LVAKRISNSSNSVVLVVTKIVVTAFLTEVVAVHVTIWSFEQPIQDVPEVSS